MLRGAVVPCPSGSNALVVNVAVAFLNLTLAVTPPSKVLATKSLFLPALKVVDVEGVDKLKVPSFTNGADCPAAYPF